MKRLSYAVAVIAVVSVASANGVANWLRMQKHVIEQHRVALGAMQTNDVQVFVSDCRHDHGIRMDYAVTAYGDLLHGQSGFFPEAPKLSFVRKLSDVERQELRACIKDLRLPEMGFDMYAVWVSLRNPDDLTATFAYTKQAATNEPMVKLLGMLAGMAGVTNRVDGSLNR